MLDRVVEGKISDVAAAMTMMLFSLPRAEARADAIVVMPGLGEWWRLTHAIRLWESGTSRARHLLIAGHNQREKTAIPLTLDRLGESPFHLKKSRGVIAEVHAERSRGQAEWIFRQVQELHISSCALFVSNYHLLRAYCTLLKTFSRHGLLIPVIPAPICISPDTFVPETGVAAWEMVQGELNRLVLYQAKGDVATYQELRQYLTWLWEQADFPLTEGGGH